METFSLSEAYGLITLSRYNNVTVALTVAVLAYFSLLCSISCHSQTTKTIQVSVDQNKVKVWSVDIRTTYLVRFIIGSREDNLPHWMSGHSKVSCIHSELRA